MYIGDSPSDLAPLAAADVGIVVGTNPLLRAVAAAAGMQLQLLIAGEPYIQEWSGLLCCTQHVSRLRRPRLLQHSGLDPRLSATACLRLCRAATDQTDN